MTWAQRLARVFKIDVTRCERCDGLVRILARLTDPAVLDQILAARGGAELLARRRFPSQAEARMATFEWLEGW